MSNTATIEPTSAASLEPTDWGDPNGKGLLAEMDDVFDPPAGQKDITSSVNIQEPSKSGEPPSTPPAEPTKPSVTPEVKPETLPAVIDEEYFSEEPETPSDAKKEEVKPDGFDEAAFDKETEEATKGMEAKAGEKFKALRAELKEAKQQKATPDVQRKLEELEMKAQEAEGLRARLEEVSSQSAKLKVEASDEYQRDIVQPATDIFKKANELAALYETDGTILRAIIKEKDRKVQNELIAEHLKDFSDFDGNETYRMIQDFNGLLVKRERMLEDADKKLQQLEVQRIEQEKQLLSEQRKAVQTIQKDIWSKWKDVIPGFLEDGEETADFKKLMSKGLSIDFGTAKARDQAFAAFTGVAFPFVVKQLVEMQARLKAYEKNDSKQLSSAPSPGSSVAATPTEKKSTSFVDEFNNMDFA